jgi:DNA modification methylase
MKFETNNVYCMDNLELLKQLNSNTIDLIYCDILYNTGRKFKDYNDDLGTPQQAMKWYIPRLTEMKRVLKDTGNIVLQCDTNLSHYLKIELDKIFGINKFKNEIYWLRTNSGKTVVNNFAKDVDILLWYSKEDSSTFNKVYKPLSPNTLKMYNKDDNDGRGKYRTVPLQKTSQPTKGTVYDYIDNEGKVWKCPKKGWRMIEEKLRILENNNRLVKTGKTLREKSYWNERESEGKICDNLWEDIYNLQGNNNEIIGYDTQKPKLLLERIIKALSNKGDTVADFFCGSGTSLVVAKELGRNYIGCDINPRAIEITESRLREIENGKK